MHADGEVRRAVVRQHLLPDRRLGQSGRDRRRVERQRELARLAAELGIASDVTFLGWVPNVDLPQYYRAAAVSVIPSLEEGFGIPAAEAMGCEVAVVASDAGGLPEVVENGVTGIVVPRGDAKALAQAIGSLLADPQRRRVMGQAGRERALRLFDWDRSAQQFEDIYREVASRMSR